jgi:hypothetical protein
MYALTRYNVTSVHSILVLDKTEAIHKFDLCNLTSAMRCEVGLDVGLGGVAREVTQVKTGGRNLCHFRGCQQNNYIFGCAVEAGTTNLRPINKLLLIF